MKNSPLKNTGLVKMIQLLSKHTLYILFIGIVFATPLHAKTHDEQVIRQILNAQVAEWNKGSLDGFMHGYWENDSLVFIGSKGLRYGYNNTLKRYKEAYPDTAHMGQLTFSIIQLHRLSRHYYFVVGNWSLQRSAGDVSGSFTLVFRKIRHQWVIVADHSS